MIRRHHTRPPATSPIRANPDPSTRRPHRQGGWPFYRMDRSSTDRPPTWLVKVIRRTAVAETPTRYLLLANVRTANIWPHCLRPSCCVLMLPSSPLQIFYDLISSCEAPIQLPRGCRLGVVPSATIAMGSAPAATGSFPPTKAAAFSQRRGVACLMLPANHHRYRTQREHARRLATEQNARQAAAAMGRHNE